MLLTGDLKIIEVCAALKVTLRCRMRPGEARHPRLLGPPADSPERCHLTTKCRTSLGKIALASRLSTYSALVKLAGILFTILVA